jgi:lipid-binding SYLF domain-containing protein
MKKNNMVKMTLLALIVYLLPHFIRAQDNKETDKLLSESDKAKSAFIKADPSMATLFESSYGYAIFPKIGKGGLIVGGSGGDGIVYEKGKAIGSVKTGQVTVGAQIGGQAYREVIFFENGVALDRLKDDKTEFSSQISAVAVKSGVSKNAKYADGVAVFTQDLGGLMAEATVGGQKFKFTAFK